LIPRAASAATLRFLFQRREFFRIGLFSLGVGHIAPLVFLKPENIILAGNILAGELPERSGGTRAGNEAIAKKP
jgi:hypothetical protein